MPGYRNAGKQELQVNRKARKAEKRNCGKRELQEDRKNRKLARSKVTWPQKRGCQTGTFFPYCTPMPALQFYPRRYGKALRAREWNHRSVLFAGSASSPSRLERARRSSFQTITVPTFTPGVVSDQQWVRLVPVEVKWSCLIDRLGPNFTEPRIDGIAPAQGAAFRPLMFTDSVACELPQSLRVFLAGGPTESDLQDWFVGEKPK